LLHNNQPDRVKSPWPESQKGSGGGFLHKEINGFVGDRPDYEYFSERSAMRDCDEPGIAFAQDFRFGVKCNDRVTMEIFAGDEGFFFEWKDFLTVTRLLQYRVLDEKPKVAELLSVFQ
jgi:hypothetical protein